MNTTSHQNAASKGVGVYPHDSALCRGNGEQKTSCAPRAYFDDFYNRISVSHPPEGTHLQKNQREGEIPPPLNNENLI